MSIKNFNRCCRYISHCPNRYVIKIMLTSRCFNGLLHFKKYFYYLERKLKSDLIFTKIINFFESAAKWGIFLINFFSINNIYV